MAEKARAEYQKAKIVYERKLKAFSSETPTVQEPIEQPALVFPSSESDIKYELRNKVVKLKPGAIMEGSEYKYWYVSEATRVVNAFSFDDVCKLANTRPALCSGMSSRTFPT